MKLPCLVFPYFKLRDPEADAQVTLRDLLSHRTGLKDHGNDDAWEGAKRSREEVIKIAMQSKPTAKFREKFQYSNVMYIAAGEAIARAQNATWEEVITSRIFKPLGLSASNFSISAMRQSADFSLGYDRGNQRKQVPMDNLASAAPAGVIALWRGPRSLPLAVLISMDFEPSLREQIALPPVGRATIPVVAHPP